MSYIDNRDAFSPCFNQVPQRSLDSKAWFEISKALFKKNYPDDYFDKNAVSPLMAAVQLKELELCQKIIKMGVPVNALNARGENALHVAAKCEDLAMVSLLLRNGVDARALDQNVETPLMYLENDRFSSPHEYVDLKLADAGFTDLMRRFRMLGMRYSLRGDMFEGAPGFVAYAELSKSLDKFMRKQPNLPPFMHELPNMIINSPHVTAEAVMAQLENNKVVSLSTGWQTHETSVVLTKDYFIKCNRGEGCEENPGITVFTIHNPGKLLKAVQKMIAYSRWSLANENAHKDLVVDWNKPPMQIKQEIRQKQIEFFNHTLIDMLDLKMVHHIKQKRQKVGNCTWLAAKMAFKAGLIANSLQIDPALKISEIAKEILPLYRAWKNFDCLQALPVVSEAEAEPLVHELIDFEVLHQTLKEIRSPYR